MNDIFLSCLSDNLKVPLHAYTCGITLSCSVLNTQPVPSNTFLTNLRIYLFTYKNRDSGSCRPASLKNYHVFYFHNDTNNICGR